MYRHTEQEIFRLGLDIGSTTVKAVVLNNQGEIVFSDYRRHNAEVRSESLNLLQEIEDRFPGLAVEAAITGSGGLSVANSLGVEFVQEVIAETEAVRRYHPEADVIIELGGEDAKLTYLHPTPEQRMNGTCAGGTGAFIDQMASLLNTDAKGLNDLALMHTRQYPIASRCGVFAKSDLQPLINEGAAAEDLAASIFTAVATQTISGLACGRPIRGTVIFLGGPLHFLPELQSAYRTQLPKVTKFIAPEDGQLYVALGAAYLAQRPIYSITELCAHLQQTSVGNESARMPALFANEDDRRYFTQRHGIEKIEQIPASQAKGRCWLGIDAGSTTIKAVVIDEDNRIVFSHYASNQGNPIRAAVEVVRSLQTKLPEQVTIGRSCSTGYGEGLVTAALHMDEGEVETMAHFRAADSLHPGVSSVIDIGGQDMKYLRIRNGCVDSIAVNEACSSGCGSFLQTFAQTMEMGIEEFAQAATQAKNPVDLGTRCTVFMNSSVKQAQKEGADVSDIAAGLCYSVVRNALYKVIKLRDTDELGDKVVVQGGTFLNDAVLRAFENLTGVSVVRPTIAGLMGAYGAALTARMHDDGISESSLATLHELESFSVETTSKTCRLCQNHCQMTISNFSNGVRHVSGNRCDRGASLEKLPSKSELPNLYDWKYKRVFGYRRLTEAKAHRGDIGIPRVLNMYENYPFWFTLLSHLGFRVMISGRSSHDTFERGMESIPSENVCYPAKLVHGHIEQLLDKGVTTIFYPCVSYEEGMPGADNNFNCPVVATYPEVIRNNLTAFKNSDATLLAPFVNLSNREYLPKHLCSVFSAWNVSFKEMKEAVDLAYTEAESVRREIRSKGEETLSWLQERGIKGVVLAGRPYHLDPEINHGIPELVVGLGMGVLTEDSIIDGRLERPLRVRDQWSYHSRLYEAAARVGDEPDLQLVQLNSFGCGLDAITSDQVQEILEARRDVHTIIKIDEVSNLGAAKIRMRSLQAATAERSQTLDATVGQSSAPCVADVARFTPEMRKDGYEILAPQMSPIHFNLLVPVLRTAGYNVRLLERTDRHTNEVGLKYVNNDACYPAIVVIGQLLEEFQSGRANPDRTAVAITQTGGMCRATNYAGLLRKGLADAGYDQVPVIAVSAQGLEDNPGFQITVPLVHRLVQAGVLGDMLQSMLLRVRPYEKLKGSATELYHRCDQICREWLSNNARGRRFCPSVGRKLSFSQLIRLCVSRFTALPLLDIARKPRVGLVGEILVKFHPDANNHAIETIEREGCEAELPGMMQFFHNSLSSAKWNTDNLGIRGWSRWLKPITLRLLEQYEIPVRQAFAETDGLFEPHRPIMEMAAHSTEIARMGNQAGEGWYLTAEMVDMIEHGCPNIICVQPFACLPNHVVGKGMFRPLRDRYPHANIVSVDYDPGTSEVNQINRIKLMISTAILKHDAEEQSEYLHLSSQPTCPDYELQPGGKTDIPEREHRAPLPLSVAR